MRQVKTMRLTELYNKLMKDIDEKPELEEMKRLVNMKREAGQSILFALDTKTCATTIESLPEGILFDQLVVK